MKKWHYLVLLGAIAIVIIFRFFNQSAPDNSDLFTVVRVLDGDTVELKERGTVRLLFIDAPEKGDLYYDSATIYLENRILGRKVSLEFGNRARDTYGRLLAFIYLDTVLVNLELVGRGYAGMYLFRENNNNEEMLNRFLSVQRSAVSDNLGIWSVPYHEEEFYVGNRRSYRFHRPECKSIRNMNESRRIEFETREAALMEGLSPCRNCRP